MLNWISQNKQWLFSGVGVSAVLVICGFLYRRFNGRRSPSSISAMAPSLNPQTTSASLSLTKPDPVEIKKHISALPPFQQLAAAKSYIGLKVCWKAVFRNLWEEELPGKDKKVWTVLLSHYDQDTKHTYEMIVCHGIDLETYPRLKIAHANEVVLVRGTIGGVCSHVDLIDTTIEFL